MNPRRSRGFSLFRKGWYREGAMAKNLHKRVPEDPGVYLMRGARGEILYIGKAANLRRRVSSYFTRLSSFAKASADRSDSRIQKMVNLIRTIDYRQTDTALEALILEAELIKKYQPPYNVLEKDDKSFLYVEITREKFPRVLIVRGKSLATGRRFGPFIYGRSIREALRILRKIFPYAIHPAPFSGEYAKNTSIVRSDNRRVLGKRHPCFDYQIGLCPGTCVGAISASEYRKNIRNLVLIFEGKKKRVLSALEREMKAASKRLDFESAEKLRRQIFGLTHIQDVALIGNSSPVVSGQPIVTRDRIEGYDISNISGTSAVGSMVVFEGGEPSRSEYRKFKIRTIHQPDDVGMLREVLRRRFSPRHAEGGWRLPDFILIDGGLGQVNAARQVLLEVGMKIPVVGIAKGRKRKKNEFVGMIPHGVAERTLIRVRDEAHRFAVSYHRELRRRSARR